MKPSSVLFGLALLTLPAGPALKMMFGSEDALWIDPTLIFSALAFAALIMVWSERDSRELVGVTSVIIVLTLLCAAGAVSGFLIRPAAKPYDALREPVRFFLSMIWLLTSYWFLRFRKRFVFRCAAAAVALGLLSGIYVDLVAAGLLPAPVQATQYAQVYTLRQIIWYNGLLIPRMGGFFVEAPPFGLFMLAMGVVFYLARRSGVRGPATASGLTISIVGALASLADQVALGMFICLTAGLLSAKSQNRWIKSATMFLIGGLLVGLASQSLRYKLTSTDSSNIRSIYKDSVGERAFHLEYGLSLFVREPAAAFLGIGPGRYGEYAAETGYFPDTVTMQSTEPEILVEWGVIGLGVWIALLAFVAWRAWRLNGVVGVGLLLGLCLADSFQSNWKSEAVFFAIAALCAPSLAAETDKTVSTLTEHMEAVAE